MLEVKPKGTEVRSSGGRSFCRQAKVTLLVRTIVSTLFKTGLESLKSRFRCRAMIGPDSECPPTTDGEIRRHQSGERASAIVEPVLSDPLRHGIAEAVIEHEQLTAQFVGDMSALDRVEALTGQLVEVEADRRALH